MSQPNVEATVVSGPLQNVTIMYKNPSYIADEVFPIVDNVPGSAKIGTYKRGAWFRDDAGIIANGSRAPRGGYPTGYVDVSLDEYGFAKPVTDKDVRRARQNNTPPLNLETNALIFCSDRVDLKKERLVAAMILNGTWCDVAGGEDVEGLWAAGAGNTFLADVRARIETISSRCGVPPNRLMITPNVLSALEDEASIMDKIKYTQKGVLTADLLASLLNLEKVVIGRAIYSTANEAADGDDFAAARVWEKNAGKGSAFLYVRAPQVSLECLTAGVQARGAYEDGKPRRVTKWREEAEHQTVFEAAEEVDFAQVAPDAGFLWKDCIAT